MKVWRLLGSCSFISLILCSFLTRFYGQFFKNVKKRKKIKIYLKFK